MMEDVFLYYCLPYDFNCGACVRACVCVCVCRNGLHSVMPALVEMIAHFKSREIPF